jgi:hypothetical protein
MKKLTYIFFLLLILTLISHRALAAEREDDDESEAPTNRTRVIEADDDYDEPEQRPEDDAPEPSPIIDPIEESPSLPLANDSESIGQPQVNLVTDSESAEPISETPADQPQIVDTYQDAQQATTTNAPVISKAFPWAWIITRASGIASYILLTAMSLLGILLTTGLIYRMLSPAAAWSLHRATASVLLLSVSAHVVSLLLDRFMNLRIVDVLIPFVSSYRPLLISLGIFGFYLLLLVLSTSLYTMTSHARFWRTVHALGFVMFALIFLHGILIGTDTKQVWMQAIYWITGALVAGAGIYRLIWRYRRIRDINAPGS